jgi:hypothetical protein
VCVSFALWWGRVSTPPSRFGLAAATQRGTVCQKLLTVAADGPAHAQTLTRSVATYKGRPTWLTNLVFFVYILEVDPIYGEMGDIVLRELYVD